MKAQKTTFIRNKPKRERNITAEGHPHSPTHPPSHSHMHTLTYATHSPSALLPFEGFLEPISRHHCTTVNHRHLSLPLLSFPLLLLLALLHLPFPLPSHTCSILCFLRPQSPQGVDEWDDKVGNPTLRRECQLKYSHDFPPFNAPSQTSSSLFPIFLVSPPFLLLSFPRSQLSLEPVQCDCDVAAEQSTFDFRVQKNRLYLHRMRHSHTHPQINPHPHPHTYTNTNTNSHTHTLTPTLTLTPTPHIHTLTLTFALRVASITVLSLLVRSKRRALWTGQLSIFERRGSLRRE